MSDNNQQYGRQYTNQGFPNYDGPIQQSATGGVAAGVVGRLFSSPLAAKLRNPVIGTAVLLLAGVAFAGILITSYPSDGEGDVPVIKAEKTAFKTTPDEPGGMDVAFEDSTIFESIRGTAGTAPTIENLLASNEEVPVDRFSYFEGEDAALAAAVAEIAPAAGDAASAVVASVDDAADKKPDVYFLEPTPPAIDAPAQDVAKTVTPSEKPAQVAANTAEQAEPFEIKKLEGVVEKVKPVDEYATKAAPTRQPSTINAPGTSPDTLAFVKSVLDKKDAQKVLDAPATNSVTTNDDQELAKRLANIAPAAGGASVAATAIEPGVYYVQLASVGSAAGAEGEWGKIKKTYSSLLQNVAHRVKRADLDKGTFYRIQAGPMSKARANAMCDKIKAQKPGGCLVTK